MRSKRYQFVNFKVHLDKLSIFFLVQLISYFYNNIIKE